MVADNISRSADNAVSRGSANMVKQFIINMPLANYKKLDEFLGKVKEANPKEHVSRNDILNQCLFYGMQVFEQMHIQPSQLVQLAGADTKIPEWKPPRSILNG